MCDPNQPSLSLQVYVVDENSEELAGVPLELLSDGVVLRRVVAGLLLGALLVTACGMLPAAGAYGVAGEQPAFETAVAAGVATALFETQQAPQAAGASGMSPSFVMEQVLRDARADIEQMVAVAVATAVAARIDLPSGDVPVGGTPFSPLWKTS